jgi:lysophospholipase L1-like esterase
VTRPGPPVWWTRSRRIGALGLAAAAAAIALILFGVLPSTPATPASPPPQQTAPATSSPSRSQPLQIVALGDSVPSNFGCPCPGYVADVGTVLQSLTHRPSEVHNDAQSGWTTADVLDDLGSGNTPGDLAIADLVIVQIGANDFDPSKVGDPACLPAATSPCWAATLAGLRTGLTRLTQRIRAINRSPGLRIALVGYWNVTVDGQAAQSLGSQYVTGSDELTAVVNQTIEAVAAESHSIYVDAFTGFKGESGTRDPTEDLLEDGDHPNAQGNQLLTAAVRDALERSGAIAAWTAP